MKGLGRGKKLGGKLAPINPSKPKSKNLIKSGQVAPRKSPQPSPRTTGGKSTNTANKSEMKLTSAEEKTIPISEKKICVADKDEIIKSEKQSKCSKFTHWATKTKSGMIISIGVIILLVLIIVVSISLPLALRENSDSDSDSETATTTTTATTAIDKTCNTTYTPCKDPNLSLCVIPLPEKITLGMRCPEVGMCPDKLCIYAARGEFEAFKLLVNGGGSSYLLGYTDIYSAHGTLDIFRADFEGDVGVEEGLYQIYNQTHIIVNQTTSLWGIAKINYGVESTKSQGERYTGQLIIGEEAIGIQLYVYDFELPREIHYFSQLNIKVKDLDPENTTMAHWNILKNRMTPKSCTWPSGFGAGITWDTDRNPNKCSSFYNESDEGNAYSILHLAEKYLLGNPEWNEWNLTYPSFMLFQFVDNSHTRPNTFCGEDLGPDQCGSTAYNTKYKEYLVSLRDYLKSINVLERSYVYIQNEPQDSEDYRVAVCLCKMYRETVPDLRIAVSEEAKKEISGECGYDIYIAHMGYDFDYEYSMGRLKEGEVSYIYSLPHDEKPWINPIKLTSHGLDALLLCWVSWLQRIRGYAYYSYSQFFRGGVGTVITQLLRESFEDYEYLYLGNNKKLPMTESNNVDNIVRQVATNFMSVSRDSMGVMNFRRDLGFWVEGGSKPAFLPTNIIHTRGEYYINFQNRTGEPSALPLIIGGKEYKKWGLEGYDSTQGLGWLGEHVGDGSNILQCKYVDIGGEYSELEKSFIYDDYGRTLLFEFSIEPGEYKVSTGIGLPNKVYNGDPSNVVIEGEGAWVDAVVDEGGRGIVLIEKEVLVVDGGITLQYGGKMKSNAKFSYTFVQYLVIIPV